MCGIVGLYLKNKSLQSDLGRHLATMLVEMTARGPDSAGFAIYRNDTALGSLKATLQHPETSFDWDGLVEAARELAPVGSTTRRDNHLVLQIAASADDLRAWLKRDWPAVRVVSIGDTIEIYKEMGLPEEVALRFDLPSLHGTHALGHTRMATESAVTTEHSHPFSTGEDLCLVHNGSLSNHNRLRRQLRRRGVSFQTDNDSEVAAGFLAQKLRDGADLRQALEAGLEELDGFFTFAVGTREGFAVVRDGIACKPAVLAETDDWVAMASEFRAIARLPEANQAQVWEPTPETIYVWGTA